MKYVIDIPSQTVEIEAPSEDEAIYVLTDYINFDISFKSAPRYYQIPVYGEKAEYYIERLYKDLMNDAWFVRQYLKDGDKAMFTDGRRIYCVPETEDISAYRNITKEAPMHIMNMKKCFDLYNPDKVKIDFYSLLEKIESAAHDQTVSYTIKVNGMAHRVNARFLLDALTFTDTDSVKIGQGQKGNFYMEGENGRSAVVLPMLYEGTKPIDIDQVVS